MELIRFGLARYNSNLVRFKKNGSVGSIFLCLFLVVKA